MLHWRALTATWFNLRSFWLLWFVTRCASTISFSNILLGDNTKQEDYRIAFFAVMVIQFVCAAILAVLIFLPDDVGSYTPVQKGGYEYTQWDDEEGGRGRGGGSLNSPFLRNNNNNHSNHNHNHNQTNNVNGYLDYHSGIVVHSPDRAINAGSTYARTEPISTMSGIFGGSSSSSRKNKAKGGKFTDVMEEVQDDHQMSTSNGSQSGIVLNSKTTKFTQNQKQKQKQKHRKTTSKERNIWDSFMEHATTSKEDNTTTATTYNPADDDEKEEQENMSQTEQKEEQDLLFRTNASLSMGKNLTLTLLSEMPMTIFVPSYTHDIQDNHVEYNIIVFIARSYLQQFLDDQHLPPLNENPIDMKNCYVEFTIQKRFRELKIFEKTCKKLMNKNITSLLPCLPSSVNVDTTIKGLLKNVNSLTSGLDFLTKSAATTSSTTSTTNSTGTSKEHSAQHGNNLTSSSSSTVQDSSIMISDDEAVFNEKRRMWIEIYLQCMVHTHLFRSEIVRHFLLPNRVLVKSQNKNVFPGNTTKYRNNNRKNRNNNANNGNTNTDVDTNGDTALSNSFVYDDEVLAGALPSGVSYTSHDSHNSTSLLDRVKRDDHLQQELEQQDRQQDQAARQGQQMEEAEKEEYQNYQEYQEYQEEEEFEEYQEEEEYDMTYVMYGEAFIQRRNILIQKSKKNHLRMMTYIQNNKYKKRNKNNTKTEYNCEDSDSDSDSENDIVINHPPPVPSVSLFIFEDLFVVVGRLTNTFIICLTVFA